MALEVFDIVLEDNFEHDLDFGDAAFRKVKCNYTNFLIWKVTKGNIASVPKDKYGTFYTEDAYLIFAASCYGYPSGPQSVNKEMHGIEYHIHFWIGATADAEKAGIAAHKTVELDVLIGGCSTQHREVQGEESPRFRSYFRNGFKVILGTRPANFVGDVFHPRLYKINGVQAPIISQMPLIKWTEFNSADVFILHTDTIMFVWIGRAASATDKLFAIQASKELHQDFKTSNTVFVDDGYEKTMNADDRAVFELYLPLGERTVTPVADVEDAERKFRAPIKLYKCCDMRTKYRVTEIKSGTISQKDLLSSDVFMLDHSVTGIWVWVGKSSSEKENMDAIRNARGFVKKKKYKNSTAVTRVVDTCEPIEFKLLFPSWQDKYNALLIPSNKTPVIKVTKFDAITMCERPAFAAKSQLFDDGTGTLKIWRIKRSQSIEMQTDSFGIFYNEDCYVLLYSYSCGDKRHIIYNWMGSHSNPDEQDTMYEHSQRLDEALDYNAILIRVSEGKEPPHFLQLVKGRMTIFQGKGAEVDVSGMNTRTPKSYLLRVHGTSTYNTRAIQVASKAASLNSNNCFVLKKNNNMTVWCGNYSTGDNREMAKQLAGADLNLVMEGCETEEFWDSLGGRRNFNTTPKVNDIYMKIVLPPRLYKCSINTSQFKAEEILFFTQMDLAPECLMLLDGDSVIYSWLGNYCPKEDKKLPLKIVQQYLVNDSRGRDSRTTIIRIKQGNEPPTFTGFFDSWDKDCWQRYKTYEDHRTEIEKEDSYYLQRITNGDTTNAFDSYDKYSIKILQSSIETLPQAVDPLNKELHLTYDDFFSLFKMDYLDFEKLPFWKRQELKKNVGLF